jgi:hypothetical protein
MCRRPTISNGLAVVFAVVIGAVLAVVSLQAATLSRQQADSFAKKMAIINQAATLPQPAGGRRTAVTETELNSWFMYRATPLLPQGVADPRITIVGSGKVMGTVIVDLEAIGKKKSSGGAFDPWSLLGGRVPVNVTGILTTKGGRGQFNLQQADISGIPVPMSVLQELVSYYSRTADDPDGVRLDDQFQLPAKIQQIEVGQAQAVVIQ